MKWATTTEAERSRRRDAQLDYENDMLLYSRSKYWDDYNRAPDEGIPEQELLDSSVQELTEVYQEWIDNTVQSKKVPGWLPPLLELGAAKMADITIRACMRCWFSSGFWGHQLEEEMHTAPLAQKVANLIAQDTVDIISYQRAKSNYRDDWMKQSKFIKNWTTKRCRAFSKKVGENFRLSVKQKHDFGHNMLRIADSSNIISVTTKPVKRGNSLRRYSFVDFHPDVLKELHKRHELLQASSIVYRPMIVPPVLHTLTASGGYINQKMRKPVVQRYKSNFFGDEPKNQKHSQPSELVLNGLNGMMLTEWSVNEPVLEVMTNMFENNTGLANLPYHSFEEFMYNEPYPDDGSKVEVAIWCQKRQEAWSEWYKQEQARARMLIRLNLANDMKKWEYFYQVLTLDFRGRAYTTCELLSCQSSDFDRGLIQFANGVPVDAEGRKWQKINIANLFDQDKLSLGDRIRWTEENEEMLARINQDPYANKEWVDDSKKKNKSFQRLAAVFDYFREDGMTFVPVQIDGQCNGSQHWSAIMKDVKVGEMVGIVPKDIPSDLYQFVADTATDYCDFHKDEIPWCGKFLDYWEGNIERKVTKRSTMCDPYGLTFYGIQKYLKVEGHLDWVKSEEQAGAIVELARAIKTSMDSCLSEPNRGKDYLKEIVNVANDLNKHVEYVTPSGFKVVHYYNVVNTRRSVAKLFGNKELTFFIASDDVNRRAALQAIAPNFIHSLDAAHMFLTLDELLRKGVYNLSMIHDSYGCHANYVGTMRNILREKFVEIHNENQLENFKACVQNQLGVVLPEVPDTGDLDVSKVLKSDYFFA